MLTSTGAQLLRGANPRVLGVIRAATGAAALMELIGSGARVVALAGPEALRIPIIEPIGDIFLAAPAVTLTLWAVAALAFAVGFATTASGAVVVLVMFGLVTSDAQLYSNHSYLIAFTALLLVLGGGGAAFSVDAVRRGYEPPALPAWTVTALRVQLTLVYAFAAVAKLNLSFLSGSVLAAGLRRGGVAIPEEWVFFEPMFVLSVITICAELFLSVALWHPRWRPAGFVVGLLLHGGIVFTMDDTWALAAFGVVTLGLYLSFLHPARGSRTVVWDDGCGFCGTWVRWFRRFDWLDALRFVPRSTLPITGLPVTKEASLEAMHVVGPRGTTRAFAAVCAVAAVLPLTFLAAALLRLAPAARIGERVYGRIAARRLCNVRPTHDAVAQAAQP